MTRSRATAKAAGSSFERLIADYLRDTVDDRIDRKIRTGAQDKGDIGGLRVLGNRVVIEAKDYAGRLMPGPWLNEAKVERGNDDAIAGIVVAKRRATRVPGEQFVLMSLDDFIAIITGERPNSE